MSNEVERCCEDCLYGDYKSSQFPCSACGIECEKFEDKNYETSIEQLQRELVKANEKIYELNKNHNKLSDKLFSMNLENKELKDVVVKLLLSNTRLEHDIEELVKRGNK